MSEFVVGKIQQLLDGKQDKRIAELEADLLSAISWRDGFQKEKEALEKQLAERDAALARCVEATKTAMSFIRLHHWNNNAPGRGVWDLDAAGSAYDSLKGATSIPTSAQATAKALAAVREHYILCNGTDQDGYEYQCQCKMCEAIREEKEGE